MRVKLAAAAHRLSHNKKLCHGPGMAKKTQKLSIRLLREGRDPKAVVKGADWAEWPHSEGAEVAFGTAFAGEPKWVKLLDTPEVAGAGLSNKSAFGVVFLKADARWFAVSFGASHVKLDPAAFEHDFGLRVVLNTVDHRKLRSADLRTPEELTVTRRTQTSRQSSSEAFGIDVEKDIVRGLAGEPTDQAFARRVAGSDALVIHKPAEAEDLEGICSEAYAKFKLDDYQEHFGWVDHIRYVRDDSLREKLDAELVAALHAAIVAGTSDDLHLAAPAVYDPEEFGDVRYLGFRSKADHPQIDILDYLADLKTRGCSPDLEAITERHWLAEVRDDDSVQKRWKLYDCIVFEVEHGGTRYVLSGGKWYAVAKSLVDEVTAFFGAMPKTALPSAKPGENEADYNERVAKEAGDLACLDRQLIRPTGATSDIEACDFFSKKRQFIHVKDEAASSRLSHLFSQGLVSAMAFRTDKPFRAKFRAKLEGISADHAALLPGDEDEPDPKDFEVVFAVMRSPTSKGEMRLPFFSLVTLRQAARQITALGFKVAFAWVEKPPHAPAA